MRAFRSNKSRILRKNQASRSAFLTPCDDPDTAQPLVTTDLSEKVIALNNTGAHHLCNGNYDQGVAFFRLAVLRANHLTSSIPDAQSPAPDSTDNASRIQKPKQDLTLETRRLTTTDDDCNYHSLHSFQSEESLICKSAIFVHKADNDKTRSRSLSTHSVQILALSAIYNLAITYHLAGLPQRSRHDLHKARQFYELAYKLQRHDAESSSSQSMLRTCVLNNLAAVHHLLGNTEKSSRIFQELLLSVCILENSSLEIDQSHSRVVWGNLMILSLESPISAAAA